MKKKIIVRIAEGLGNQMFMYANAFAIAKNFNAELIIDNKSGFFKKKIEHEVKDINFISLISIIP